MILDEAIKMYTSNAEYERTHGSLQGCLEFKQLAEWLKELKQLREQTRWIPVSERSPLEGQFVLCSIAEYADTVHRIIIAKYEKNSLYWDEFVTAWMSLPQPYVPEINVGKMEESEDKE